MKNGFVFSLSNSSVMQFPAYTIWRGSEKQLQRVGPDVTLVPSHVGGDK